MSSMFILSRLSHRAPDSGSFRSAGLINTSYCLSIQALHQVRFYHISLNRLLFLYCLIFIPSLGPLGDFQLFERVCRAPRVDSCFLYKNFLFIQFPFHIYASSLLFQHANLYLYHGEVLQYLLSLFILHIFQSFLFNYSYVFPQI